MHADDQAVKPFVWDGISLTIPQQWETGLLGEGYALLEAQSRPVLEFKTTVINGRFSAPRQLSRLGRRGRVAGPLAVSTVPLPHDWPSFPDAAEVVAFRWQAARVGGRGMLHYCRTCRRATLLQFYDHGVLDPARVGSVLASFRDHPLAWTRLAVYDITATLPEHFRLTDARFEAGRFKLVFRRFWKTVALVRLSPADIILERHRGDWWRIALDNGLLPAKATVSAKGPWQGREGMEWRWSTAGWRGPLQRLFVPGGPRPGGALRLWHCAPANRLLAVRSEGLRDDTVFEGICRGYEAV